MFYRHLSGGHTNAFGRKNVICSLKLKPHCRVSTLLKEIESLFKDTEYRACVNEAMSETCYLCQIVSDAEVPLGAESLRVLLSVFFEVGVQGVSFLFSLSCLSAHIVLLVKVLRFQK